MMQNYRGQILNIFFCQISFKKFFLIKLYIYVEHTYLYILLYINITVIVKCI